MAGSGTHARTPVRSACTRKPVMSGQARWSNRSTIVLPSAARASAATTPGSAGSVSGPLVATAGSLRLVLTRACGATANAARAASAAAQAAASPGPPGAAWARPTTMTSSVIAGADQ